MSVTKAIYNMNRTFCLDPTPHCVSVTEEALQGLSKHNPYIQMTTAMTLTLGHHSSKAATRMDLRNYSYYMEFTHKTSTTGASHYESFLVGHSPKGKHVRIYITKQLACDLVHIEKTFQKDRIYTYFFPSGSKMKDPWKTRKEYAEILFSCKIYRTGVTYGRKPKGDTGFLKRRHYHIKKSLENFPNCPEQMRLMLWAATYLDKDRHRAPRIRKKFRELANKEHQNV